jgi:tetratricopeptide (TPR) repeat protein
MRFLKSLTSTVPSALVLVAGLMFSSLSLADYAEVNRLLRAGQLAEASAKADQFLATKPKDAQMRFLKAVVLTEQAKLQDAISAFTKLIEDFPELPEPYNNLAVLYAGQGQFDKARTALEMAIRTNPSYATAHENLGDVYAKLASQAYSKALQLDSGNAGVQPKLGLIRDLFAPAAVASARPATSAPAVAIAATRPGSTTPNVTPVTPLAAASPASAPGAGSPAAQATKPVAPATAGISNEDQVRAAVQAWAAAWSRRDMSAYLAAYGKEFDAPGGRKKWEEERRKRILSKSKINVQLSNLVIRVSGDKALARFRQDYDADSLSVSSRKTLELSRVSDRWVIVRETASS